MKILLYGKHIKEHIKGSANLIVIGARSTVLSNMPKGMVCVGYPAKPIKPRSQTKNI